MAYNKTLILMIIIIILFLSVEDPLHQAQGVYHSYTDPVLVEINTADTYYPITNFSVNSIVGVELNGNKLCITREGYYQIVLGMAMQGESGADYELELFVNNASRSDCSTFVTTSVADHKPISVNCIIYLYEDDELDVRVKDFSTPPKDLYYYQLNFNIVEIK